MNDDTTPPAFSTAIRAELARVAGVAVHLHRPTFRVLLVNAMPGPAARPPSVAWCSTAGGLTTRREEAIEFPHAHQAAALAAVCLAAGEATTAVLDIGLHRAA